MAKRGLTQGTAEKLDSFERRILRRIYGPMYDKREWRIRYNDEIYQLYKELRLSVYVRLRRLQWSGHIQRMQDGRIPKEVLDGQLGGKRPMGKPRARWEDVVGVDAREILGIRNWRGASRDKDEWRRRIEEARA